MEYQAASTARTAFLHAFDDSLMLQSNLVEMAAENGGFRDCFQRPFHRTSAHGPRRFRLLRQALTVSSLHVQATDLGLQKVKYSADECILPDCQNGRR